MKETNSGTVRFYFGGVVRAIDSVICRTRTGQAMIHPPNIACLRSGLVQMGKPHIKRNIGWKGHVEDYVRSGEMTDAG